MTILMKSQKSQVMIKLMTTKEKMNLHYQWKKFKWYQDIIVSSSQKRLKTNQNKNNNLSYQFLQSNDNNKSSNQETIRSDVAERKLSKVGELEAFDINKISDELLLELVEKRKLLTNINSSKNIISRENHLSMTRELDSRSVIFPSKFNYGHGNNVEQRKDNLLITIANTPSKRVPNTQSTSNPVTFHPGTKKSSKSSVDVSGKKLAVRCYKCGRTHKVSCKNNHTDANKDKAGPWFASPNGRAWKQRGEKFLPEDVTKTLENTPLVITQPVVLTAANK
jgi:hypothetical protein